jgi:hypothetical protein
MIIDPYRYAVVGGSSTLLNNLVAWWTMEGTGNRADSSGNGYTLTDNNTVAAGTGRVGNAADLSPASGDEYFSSTDSALYLTGSWTIALWLKMDVVNAYEGIAGVNGNKWRIYSRDGNRFRFEYNGSTHDFTFVHTTGTWYSLIFGKNTATNKVFCTMNNATLVEAANTGVFSGGTSFRLGKTDLAGGANLDGMLDEVAYWSRVLTADERTEYHNYGTGITYSDL